MPEPKMVRHADWAKDPIVWQGNIQGHQLGTGVTVLFFSTDRIGHGPKLHVHDYDEVFIVREGRALFTIGDDTVEAGTGDVLLGPAGVPHKFVNLGPGRLETTDIHHSDRWVQTDLE
ncbi:cupin domain-containing protein [Pseudoruegeria sp. HB172150]|uniref:cupin domain-containing protein n=1 Tax=Pseudoruegeria sp. HB172150 TaxID=2721164 RepID=UPI0015578074|nr:cupin domain-containing protein [Pseudoruegeria sp. HB172150]